MSDTFMANLLGQLRQIIQTVDPTQLDPADRVALLSLIQRGMPQPAAPVVTPPPPKFQKPIQCTLWCDDGDGHPREYRTVDQYCVGPADYMYAPLNHRSHGTDGADDDTMLGVMARRDNGYLPCVQLHVLAADHNDDLALKLTPAEAHWLAKKLLDCAELVDATECDAIHGYRR